MGTDRTERTTSQVKKLPYIRLLKITAGYTNSGKGLMTCLQKLTSETRPRNTALGEAVVVFGSSIPLEIDDWGDRRSFLSWISSSFGSALRL